MSKAISSKATSGPLEAGPAEVLSRPAEAQFNMPVTSIQKVEADGVRVFYRAAGDATAPVVLLLHGFPTSSFMFRELIPRLANRLSGDRAGSAGFRIHRSSRPNRKYVYSFDGLARTIEAFTEATQNQPLCNLRVRLWRANRFPLGDGSPGPSHSDRFTERECI